MPADQGSGHSSNRLLFLARAAADAISASVGGVGCHTPCGELISASLRSTDQRAFNVRIIARIDFDAGSTTMDFSRRREPIVDDISLQSEKARTSACSTPGRKCCEYSAEINADPRFSAPDLRRPAPRSRRRDDSRSCSLIIYSVSTVSSLEAQR